MATEKQQRDKDKKDKKAKDQLLQVTKARQYLHRARENRALLESAFLLVEEGKIDLAHENTNRYLRALYDQVQKDGSYFADLNSNYKALMAELDDHISGLQMIKKQRESAWESFKKGPLLEEIRNQISALGKGTTIRGDYGSVYLKETKETVLSVPEKTSDINVYRDAGIDEKYIKVLQYGINKKLVGEHIDLGAEIPWAARKTNETPIGLPNAAIKAASEMDKTKEDLRLIND